MHALVSSVLFVKSVVHLLLVAAQRAALGSTFRPAVQAGCELLFKSRAVGVRGFGAGSPQGRAVQRRESNPGQTILQIRRKGAP
jgi:hypothetical protein